MTILLPDENVAGLQVRRKDSWVTVKPAPNAFIINIGDQIQVTLIKIALFHFGYILLN
jgi:isopenicillin N synthase-like dioxygenase